MTKSTKKLTGRQARYLRSLGHSLKPVVRVGKSGLTASLLDQVRKSLEVHELIKVKLIQPGSNKVKQAAENLSRETDCFTAQVIGKTILLYKQRKDDPRITLPQ